MLGADRKLIVMCHRSASITSWRHDSELVESARICKIVILTEFQRMLAFVAHHAFTWVLFGDVYVACLAKEEQKMRRQIDHHRNHRDRSIAKQVSDFISVNINLPLTMCNDVN